MYLYCDSVSPNSSDPSVHEWSVFLGPEWVNRGKQFVASVAVRDITVSNMAGSNIALMQLSEPVSSIQPVCLDLNEAISFPSQCWVAGWGSRNRGDVLSFCLKF